VLPLIINFPVVLFEQVLEMLLKNAAALKVILLVSLRGSIGEGLIVALVWLINVTLLLLT